MSDELQTYYTARELIVLGQHREAIPLLIKAIELNEHFKSRELLGFCYEVEGKLELTCEQYTTALRLNNRSNKTQYLLAAVLVKLGRIDEAKRHCSEIVQRSQDYGPARRLLQQLAP